MLRIKRIASPLHPSPMRLPCPSSKSYFACAGMSREHLKTALSQSPCPVVV